MTDIEVMIGAEEIQNKIVDIAKEINDKYKGQELYIICILKGAVVFTVDLIKKLSMPVELDFMIVSSYNGTETTGNINIIKDINGSIEGKNILIVEDIIDTGLTLYNVKNILNSRGPKSIEICTLIDKKERRKVELNSDYVGFDIPNEFIVGYGLDLDEKYRNLPYIGKIKN